MKLDEKLYIKWSKKEQDLMIYYPCRQGKWLGHDIAKAIKDAFKEYVDEFDITSVKCEIKLTEKKKLELKENPPLRD